MSSIIASSDPPPASLSAVETPGTGRGVLSSFSMPIDWASRRAGSMVSTTTLRPRSAARSASAAEVVVLPTPPDPQHTITWTARSSSSASTSSAGAAPGREASGPTRALVSLIAGTPRERERSRGVRSCHSLFAQVEGQLVEAAEVDPVGEPVQLVGRHAALVDADALLVLELAPLRMRAGLVQQLFDERGRDVDPGLAEVGLDRVAGEGSVQCRIAVVVELLRPRQVHDDSPYRQVVGAQLCDSVDSLLHRHVLEHGHQVDCRSLRLQQAHHPLRLAAHGADPREVTELTVDVEELRDPAGRRCVEHHGVVPPGTAVARVALDRLEHLPGQQDVAQAWSDRGREVDDAEPVEQATSPVAEPV